MDSNNKIKKNEWYKIILDDGEKYIGKCVQESFLDEIEGICKVRILACESGEKGNFSDFSIPMEKIKDKKLLVTKKIINNKIWEIRISKKNSFYEFDVVYYNKFNADKIAKEMIPTNIKRVKTFEDIEKAVKFLERQR